jgi:hypothetical protein
MYYIVSAARNDLNYRDIVEAVEIDDMIYVQLREGAEAKSTWSKITKAQFNDVRPSKREPIPAPESDTSPDVTAEKLVRLEAQNLIIMDALATVYVETLGDKADDQTLTDLYTPLVEAGRKTVEQVPEKIKDAVQGRLSAKGAGDGENGGGKTIEP